MNKFLITVFVSIGLLVLIPFIFLGIGYILYPDPPKSVFSFNINRHRGVWTSGGFEGVGNERDIQFYSSGTEEVFGYDNLIIGIKEPAKAEIYNENNVRIQFFRSSDNSGDAMMTTENSNGKLRFILKKWSEKPRGPIDGDIDAVLVNKKGEKFLLKGSFKAYQANGTMVNFH